MQSQVMFCLVWRSCVSCAISWVMAVEEMPQGHRDERIGVEAKPALSMAMVRGMSEMVMGCVDSVMVFLWWSVLCLMCIGSGRAEVAFRMNHDL